MKKTKYFTANTEDILNTDLVPLKEYPRMQFKRNSFFNLNGLWDMEITKNKTELLTFPDKIMVPYPLESTLSGKAVFLPKKHFLNYQKKFVLPEEFLKDITYLHFGAVDQKCEVYLNGIFLGSNEGGYFPFTFDVTKVITLENTLKVIVSDDQNEQTKLAFGKQSTKRGGMWYTEVTGIWQTVWLESVPLNHFQDIKITPDIDKESISFEIKMTGNPTGELIIRQDNNSTLKFHFSTAAFSVKIPTPHLWSPTDPYLYYFTLDNGIDRIDSYFAMRKFSVGINNDLPCLMLNNEPYFYNGLLDQGYFHDGIYTPSSYQKIEDDILLMKDLGYNTLRKHIKIEPLYWYYLCDKIGMIVWQDMVNSGAYSFFTDTASPTFGFKSKKDTKKPMNETFKKEVIKTINLLYNSPSIALWTIFNEGWGQHQSKYYYDLIMKIDKTRLIDHASGWSDQKISDVNSIHIYFKKVTLKNNFKNDKRPLVLSEFGGYSYKVPNHSFNINKTYGYRFFSKQEKFEDFFVSLYEKEIIPLIDSGLSAAIYTQVSDVEDETNGLVTYDREVLKVNKDRIKKVMDRCKYIKNVDI